MMEKRYFVRPGCRTKKRSANCKTKKKHIGQHFRIDISQRSADIADDNDIKVIKFKKI